MKAINELEEKGIERCPECKCAIGGDWDYVEFSNKTRTKCPQCNTEIDCRRG